MSSKNATGVDQNREDEDGRINNAQSDVQPDTTKSITQWRKRPVVVDVFRYNGSNGSDFFGDKFGGFSVHDDHLEIHTLEGRMRAEPGDYIIRGVEGETYPCKPSVFEKTYERVSEHSATDHEPSTDTASLPSSRPMTPYTIGVDFAYPDTMTLRQHTKLTDEILEVIDQQPLNRYEVALRLTRWAENYGQEIAREAAQSLVGEDRFNYEDDYNQAYSDGWNDAKGGIRERIAELTQKPPQPLADK